MNSLIELEAIADTISQLHFAGYISLLRCIQKRLWLRQTENKLGREIELL